jgi:murein DD-endopeptidase MepM/ murein hydrolase activator NlpD
MPLALSSLLAVFLAATPRIAPPIQGMQLSSVRDMFHEIHNGHPHEAIDIMEPRGTPVLAVVPGTIRKLFLSKPGGITVYEVDGRGIYCYYYAHLDRYAEGLHEQMRVAQGDVIGFVGSTGNASANAPHLHFAIFELGPEKDWWKGRAIDPYQSLVEAIERQK